MQTSNAILIGWNQAIPGREKRALEHFMEFHAWLATLKSQGTITGWQDVILNPHGGDMNGFILVTGDAKKLDEFEKTEAWLNHLMRGVLNMTGFGAIRATTGDQPIAEMMQTWAKHI
jgi:hypothetical protein